MRSGCYVKRGTRHEHRVVAEEILGRPLRRGEVVHHKDENKRNNAPENLQVMSASEHARLHHLGRPKPVKTCCKRGHPLAGDNVRTGSKGERRCATCSRAYDNAWRKRQRRARGLKRPGARRGYKQTAEHIAKRFAKREEIA